MVADTCIGPRWLTERPEHRPRRPKPVKLVENPRLGVVVEEKLEDWWSPPQISEWLTEAYL